jgi:hypothetical protein
MKSMLIAAHIKVYHIIFIPMPHTRARTEAMDCASDLCKLIAKMKNDGSPVEWMLSLPLYHFLKEQSEPYGEAELKILWERDLHLGLNSAKRKASNSER